MLDLDGPGAGPARVAREVIKRQVAHMVRLVDDLLDVSRITRNRLTLRPEPVVVGVVIEQAVDAVRPLLDAALQELHVDLPDHPLRLLADPVRMVQVLTNRLANASKYSAPGQRVILRGRLEEGAMKLQAEDHGIGIAPDELPRVFETFAQAAPALDRAEGGLGIGLWLSRQLVELQGGGIDAASTLAELLRLLCCIVDTAFDGPRALQRAEAFAPDVVLLDIGLPQMNGYAVCRRLRARDGAALRIVAMTGWGQEEDRRRSREAGFDLHLVKPVDPAALVDALNAQASTARPAAAAEAVPEVRASRSPGGLVQPVR